MIKGLHRLSAALPVLDEVGGQRREPLRCAVDGVDHGDALLDPGPLGVVETRGCLVGSLVEVLLGDALGQTDLDQPRLEVHRDGRAVLDGPGQVVDVDVVAEDLVGVAVVERDRGAGERDERGVRQGVAQVPGVAVEVVVVAAVRLVDDHDDVAAVRQQRVLGAGLLLVLVRPNFCSVVK